MNKLLTLLALACGTLALKLTDGGFTKEELIILAAKDKVIVKEQTPWLGPPKSIFSNDTSAPLIVVPGNQDKKGKLSQVDQFACSDTFTRLTNNLPNITDLIATNQTYTDTSYGNSTAMWMKNVTKYTWSRLLDVFPQSSGYSLFQGNQQSSIQSDDILQGFLGDCWFLSTIASVAQINSRIWNIFDQKTLNNAGVYTLRLYDMGVPISIVIDDFIPMNAYGNALFSKVNVQQELWPLLLEKAFSKLNGNYWSIEGGFPLDAGYMMMGTAGNWYLLSTKTTAVIFSDLSTWVAQNQVISAGTAYTKNGIIGGHAYSVLGAYNITGVNVNGTSQAYQIVKIRNPWGNTEWLGAFGDADVFWTNNPAVTSQVGFLVKNDGDFFMTVADFQLNFYFICMNYDSTNMKQSYWMALGNGNTLGVTGTSTYCGAQCKRTTFSITSPVAQTVYLNANLHSVRQYISQPCTNSGYSQTSPYRYHYTALQTTATATTQLQSYIWDDSYQNYNPVAMTANQTYFLIFEIDWTRQNIQPDFSVTAWATKQAVLIKESKGTLSSSYPLFGGNNTVTPSPTPIPKPVPVLLCNGTITAFKYNNTNSAIVMSNGCDTQTATFNISMALTQWSNITGFDSNHQNPTCTVSGTNKICTFKVAPNNPSLSAIIWGSPKWDGNFSYTLSLA